jgi:hypothetical protein
MNIVLRNRFTGRYYNGQGRWVRRADNALVFNDLYAARAFSRKHHLAGVQPVQRFAPYMMALLRRPSHSSLEFWRGPRAASYMARAIRFSHN